MSGEDPGVASEFTTEQWERECRANGHSIPESVFPIKESDAPARCRRCKVSVERKPLAPGKRVCAGCDEYIRAENKRRRAKKHAHEMAANRARGVQPMEGIIERAQARRAKFIREIVALAELTGRVPKLVQVAAIMQYKSQESPEVRLIRREAFGLRPLRRNEARVVIPYPVPVEYLEQRSEAS